MLQRLTRHIAECHERAADCAQRAEHTGDSARKTDLLNMERTWTHLARSYEFVESLERFLLDSRNHQTKSQDMSQLALTRAESLKLPRCPDCRVTMRLLGIEAHPTIDGTDLLTYVCSRCDGLQTEIKPLVKLTTSSSVVTAMDLLLANRAFDSEATHLLGSTFDAAWERVQASDGLPTDEEQVCLIRESLAKFIIAMVEQGERNPDRLIERALRHRDMSPD